MSVLAPLVPPAIVSRSKIERPSLSGQWVRRPWLEARLDRALDRTLLVIVAPAGHGKTSTLVSWLDRRQFAAAWVTVDSRDADLTRFATHVAVALDRVAPGILPPLAALLAAPDRLAPPRLGEAFGDALYDLERDVLLILDDLHAATGGLAAAFVNGLVGAAPRRLHTIIASRGRVPIPLARLRTMGEVEELTGADLRFSPEETAHLLRLESGAPVDPGRAAAVQASVGGWPAAIRLIALSGATDAAVLPPELLAERPAHLLRDYLGEEVLARLPASQRALLLRASLVDRFNLPLLDTLATAQGGEPVARADLEQIRALELFREIPGLSETWFAYHPLFREVLRGELVRTNPLADIAAVRRSIVAWFVAAGLTRDAVQHLVALDDIPAAVALIEARLGDAFDREDWHEVASWLRVIPFAAVLESMELLLASAWVAYLGGREGRIAEILAQLRQPDRDRLVTDVARAEIALLAAWPEDPIAAVQTIEDSLSRIPVSRRYRYGYAQMALGMALASAGRTDDALARLAAFTERESARIDAASIRGYFGRVIVLWQSGRLARCDQVAADLLQLAATNGLPVSAGWGAVFLAAVAHERGELERASRHLGAVIADSARVHFLCVRDAFVLQTLAYVAQGAHEQADLTMTRLRELVYAAESPHQLDLVDALGARVALIRGDVHSATRWLDSSSPGLTDDDLKSIELPWLTRSKILIAMRTPATLREADGMLAAFLASARSQHMALALLEALAVQALLHEARGEPSAATRTLRESLALAAPEGIVQRYAYLGPSLGPILRRLLAEPAPAPHARAVLATLEAVLAAQPGATRALAVPRHDPPLVPLSEREREVLRLLARRLTNNEIGDELFISPITVKHHIANISGKFAIAGRRAVVARAAELGLLD